MSILNKIDMLLKKLNKNENDGSSLATAIEIADAIMLGILPDNKEYLNQFNRKKYNMLELPPALPKSIYRSETIQKWYKAHIKLPSTRMGLKHFSNENCDLESHFFWLNANPTKQIIAATTQLTENWEDSELSKKLGDKKVSIDFILTSDASKLLMVVSNLQNLRVMELNGKLSNTQKKIFKNLLFKTFENEESINNQDKIHSKLWNALHLKTVNKNFYDGIVLHFNSLVESLKTHNKIEEKLADRFTSRLLGRLLFIWFLREKGLINQEKDYFSTELDSTEYYESTLKHLFFSIFNQPKEQRISLDTITPYLNGGLFDESGDFYEKKLIFPRDYFKTLYKHFNEFNFTTDESSPDYEIIAIDPEMLGQIFESLLAAHNDDDNTSIRSNTGAFYTPKIIVNNMAKEALRNYLYRRLKDKKYYDGIDKLMDLPDAEFIDPGKNIKARLWGGETNRVVRKVIKALDEVKILDPAVGSGAYPIGILQVMTKLYERLMDKSKYKPYDIKLRILENNIYGVDINPMAIELSRLRAWLSLIVDDEKGIEVKPLPNLDFKFLSANSLVPLVSTNDDTMNSLSLYEKTETIRKNYFNARVPSRKLNYQREYYDISNNVKLFESEEDKQIKTFNPFDGNSVASFFDSRLMFGINDSFDIVIGNPPYGSMKNSEERKSLSKKYTDVPDYEKSNYFIERSVDFLRNDGIISFIVPNTVITNVNAEKFRKRMLEVLKIKNIINLTDQDIFESAVVNNIILTFQPKQRTDQDIILSYDITDKEKDLTVTKQFMNSNLDSWLNIFYRDNQETELINKIREGTIPLEEYCEISQGLLPYDVSNGTPIEIRDKKAYHATSKITDDHKKLLSGKDVRRFVLEWGGKEWIKYGPWLGNPRDPKYFNGERLLFREITNPSIQCAFTSDEYYNTPSIINAINFKNIDIFYILGIANSKLMTFYHKKKSSKANKGTFPKLLVKDVRNLPIKLGEEVSTSKLIELTHSIMTRDSGSEEFNDLVNRQIDNLVYEIYCINEDEINLIENTIIR